MNNTKSFETKQKTHVTTQPPQVHEESFENREKISTHRDWSWTPNTDQNTVKKRLISKQYNEYDSFDAHWSKEIDQPKPKEPK